MPATKPDRSRQILPIGGRSIAGFDDSEAASWNELFTGNGPDPYDSESKLSGPIEFQQRRRSQDSYRWNAS